MCPSLSPAHLRLTSLILSYLVSDLSADYISPAFKIISQTLSLLSPSATPTIAQTIITSHSSVQQGHPAFSLLPHSLFSAQQPEASF